jgi:flagellar hook-basal body protein
MSNTNNVSLFTKSTDTQGANLGGVKSPGHKKRQNQFINSFIGSSKGGISYVKSTTRSTVSEQGKISTGTLDSDIAIEGSGMLLVSKNATGEKVFTRRGDFQKDRNGYWKNGGGMLLQAWKLDNNGKLPANSTLLSSLEAVNFANVKGTPVATTIVSLAMNLDGKDDKLPIRGAGFTATLKTNGLNGSTGKSDVNDIIFPDRLQAGGGITLGDQFTFTSTPPGIAKTVNYGGIAVSNLITNARQIYGATNASTPFINGIPAGAKLTINGTAFTFQIGNPNPSLKQFNSLSSLAEAINKTKEAGLTARIDNNSAGRLYIAPTNPNAALTFEGTDGGANIPADLGLFNIAAGVDRFYSLDTLQKAVNTAGDASLKATIENGSIKITSKLATAAFTLNGNSAGTRSFANATRGDNTEAGRAKFTIDSPNHGLQEGDLVKINGLGGGAQIPNGIYAVGRRSNDTFEVYAMTNAPQAVAGLTLADGIGPVAPAVFSSVPGRTWQKVPGQNFSNVATAFGNPGIATVIDAAAGNLRVPAAGHTLAVNDVIYIRDFGKVTIGAANISVPDGYYRVTVVAGGSFDFIPAYKSLKIAGGGAAAGVAPAGAEPYAPAAGLNFHYQKVGFTAVGGFGDPATGATFNANVMATTGGGGSNRVKLFTTDTTYSVNDFISFKDLAVPFVPFDNITVNNNIRYKVVAVDLINGSVTFEVPGGAATLGTGDAGGNAGTRQTNLQLGVPFNVNNISQTMKYLNMLDNQQNTGPIQAEYVAVYNPQDPTKSLKALQDRGIFDSEDILTNEVTVFDSLGDAFALQFRFAKLDIIGKWAVSASLKANADDTFSDPALRVDGQIQYGVLEFDNLGRYINGSGISDVLRINRSNGSATSTITIDWANALNEQTSATMSQFASPNNIEPYQQNGRSSGTLLDNGLSVDDEGFIIGTFDNGEVVKLYQIPVAMFANINGLLEGNDGTYRITGESGQAFLKQAGQGGAGQILGRAVEDSNADTTDELLEVQDTANVIRANARVASVKFSNIATILSELKQ